MVTQRYQFESNSQLKTMLTKWLKGVYGHTKIPIWKQFTTGTVARTHRLSVFMVTQRYQFESNSQPYEVAALSMVWCLWSHKDTNLKAIHNIS